MANPQLIDLRRETGPNNRITLDPVLRRHLYGRRRKRRIPPVLGVQPSLRTDSSDKGPEPGHPVLIPASMMGDRAFVIFAAPRKSAASSRMKC